MSRGAMAVSADVSANYSVVLAIACLLSRIDPLWVSVFLKERVFCSSNSAGKTSLSLNVTNSRRESLRVCNGTVLCGHYDYLTYLP